MNRKKILLIFIILIIIISVIVLIQLNTKRSIPKEMRTEKTFKISEKFKKPVLEDQGINILNFSWEFLSLSSPAKVMVYKVGDGEINDNLLDKFKNYFGFIGKPIRDDKNIIAFVNKPEGKTFYINKQDSIASYHIDLQDKEVSKNKKLSDKELREELLNIVNEIIERPSDLDIEFSKVERQEVSDSLFLPSKNPDSRIVYMEANYKLKDFLVFTKRGAPISARFYDDGTLLKLSINLPFFVQEDMGQMEIKNIDEIKKLPGYEFKVLSINNDGKINMLSENSKQIIKDLKIEKGYLAYVHEKGNNILHPYWVFEGGGLVMGTPALLDNAYN